MHGGQNTESYTLLCTKKLERMQASDKLMPACTHAETFKGNAQFVKNTSFGLWGKKKDSSTPKNVLQNTSECMCDYLRYVTFLICLRWTVASFWGVILNIFLAWMFFNAHNKRIATKLAENMGREHPENTLNFYNLIW